MQLTEDVLLPPGLPAVYIKSRKTIIISDLHFGFETAVLDEGIYLPKVQLKKAIELLNMLTKTVEAKELVIAGDIKHVFEKLTLQEREEITKFLSLAKDYYDKIVLVRGNHDNYVSLVLHRFDVGIVPKLQANEYTLVIHGHEYDDEIFKYNLIVMGHEHPSLRIPDELGGALRFPSFLLVPLGNNQRALVLPPAGHYQSGNPVSLDANQYLSPLIRDRGMIPDTVPLVIDFGKMTLEFPKLSTLALLE